MSVVFLVMYAQYLQIHASCTIQT